VTTFGVRIILVFIQACLTLSGCSELAMVLAAAGEETASSAWQRALQPGLLAYWLKSVKGGGC